jgi:MFS family permease
MAPEDGAPSAPQAKTSRIFHGWILVGVTLVTSAFATGTGTWAVSLFVLPMTHELGWSRSAFFGALTARAVVSGLLSPFIGPFQDTKHGPRRLMFITAIGMSASMMLLCFVQSLPAFYVLFGLMGTLTSIGGPDMLLNAVLPKWFIRKRSQAMTIASAGSGAGPLVFPLIVSAVIDAAGWRVGWLVLGIAALLVFYPMAFTVRTRPEDMGLQPDGEAPAPGRAAAGRVDERNFTRAEAIKARSFWLVNISGALFIMVVTGLQTSWLVYFQDIGFTATTAALSATAFGFGSFTSRFIWGTIARRYEVRFLMAAATTMTALTVLLLFQVNTVATMLLVAGLNGLCLGGNFVMRPLIVANYFGRAHLGAITGVMRPFAIAGGASGPLAVAALFDFTESWHIAFGLVIVIWLASALSVAAASPPAAEAS